MQAGSLGELGDGRKFGMSYVASTGSTFSIEKEGETGATTRVSKMIVLPAPLGDLIVAPTLRYADLSTSWTQVGSFRITSSGKWYITSNWHIKTKAGNSGFCKAELQLASGITEIKKSGNAHHMLVERVSVSLCALFSFFFAFFLFFSLLTKHFLFANDPTHTLTNTNIPTVQTK
jgi:hypothetical protein